MGNKKKIFKTSHYVQSLALRLKKKKEVNTEWENSNNILSSEWLMCYYWMSVLKSMHYTKQFESMGDANNRGFPML